jgi:hypothetical protein
MKEMVKCAYRFFIRQLKILNPVNIQVNDGIQRKMFEQFSCQ